MHKLEKKIINNLSLLVYLVLSNVALFNFHLSIYDEEINLFRGYLILISVVKLVK